VRASTGAEKIGIPSVSFVITDFIPLANHTARGEGMPGIRIAEYPGAIQTHSDAEIGETVEKRIVDSVVEGLTGKLVENRVDLTGHDPTAILFEGTFERGERIFLSSRLDGRLPSCPDHTQGKGVPEIHRPRCRRRNSGAPLSYLRATPWNIAVNAVMAGCRPEYMPVLVAAVEAIADPEFRLKDIGNTCGCRPFFLVNGPITKDLAIYSGTGLMSPGAKRLEQSLPQPTPIPPSAGPSI